MDNQKKFYFIVTAVIIFFLIIGITQGGTKNDVTTNTTTEETVVSTPEEIEEEENNSVDEGKTPIKLHAVYDGSKKAGTSLDNNNQNITVTAKYEDGTTEDVVGYTIIKPVKLKAGKTSTVEIVYKDLIYKLKVKCSTLTAKQYKQKCKHISYKQLARYPKKYDGKKVKFTGKIIQVIEDDVNTCFRIDVTKGAYGIWDDTVYVEYWGNSDKRFLDL